MYRRKKHEILGCSRRIILKCILDIYDVNTWTRMDCVRYDVRSAMRVTMLSLWVVTPCSLVGWHRRFGETCCTHLQPPKPCYQPWSPHGVTTQNNMFVKLRIVSSGRVLWTEYHRRHKYVYAFLAGCAVARLGTVQPGSARHGTARLGSG
jgi:hypothetical protein